MRKHGFLAAVLSMVLVVCSLLPCISLHVVSAADTPTLSLDKTTYLKGETVTITTANVPHSQCYVAILVKGYKNYTNDATGANGGDRRATIYCTVDTLTYNTSKLAEGDYVAALFGDGWHLYQQVEFSVQLDPNAPKFTVDKARYTKGESISFAFTNTTASHKVAILKDGFTNYTDVNSGGDRMAVVYSSSASVTYSTNKLPGGRYALVLFQPTGWNEISRTYIEVVDPANPKSFALDKTTYTKGEDIKYTFTNTVTGDYIAIFPRNATSYATRYGYTVLKARQTSHTFSTSSLPAGDYTVRLFDNTGSWTLLSSLNFTVEEAPPEKSFSLPHNEVGVGSQFTFTCLNTTTDDSIVICPVSAVSDIASTYVAQQSCSSPTFTADSRLPAGRYVAYLCENGSYSSVISQIYFAVRSYVNDGSTITFYEQAKITLSNEPHTEVTNKLFIGWTKEDGSSVANEETLPAGTKLVAKYADFSLAQGGDFYVFGVQMRTTGVQGLRFILERSNALAGALPNAEFGTLVLPAVVLNHNNWADLTYGSSFSYEGSTYDTAVVPAINLFKTTDTAVQYTACLTNLDTEKYNRQYMVRGYMKFIDWNGNEAIAYSDEYATRLYAVSAATLNSGLVSDTEVKATLQSVITKVDTHIAQKYNEVRLTVNGSPADPNTYIYQLKDSGLNIREVTVNSEKDGEAVELVYLTDPHLSTTKTTAVAPLRKILDYASTADKILLGGDNIDAVSQGNFKIFKRELWDMAPDAFATIGNHDIANATGTTMSNDQLLNALQDNWNHDIYYSSAVLKDKVMVIQLYNGDKAFHQEQIQPLTDDLALAREKGYAVVMMTHIALCTNNPAETAVTDLRGGTVTYNFYSNQYNDFVGSSRLPEGATKTVYELIVNNADIIDALLTGHTHSDYYTEIVGKSPTGGEALIPQYTVGGAGSNNLLKITVE